MNVFNLAIKVNDVVSYFDHNRLGPKMIAKLPVVILFSAWLSTTCNRNKSEVTHHYPMMDEII